MDTKSVQKRLKELGYDPGPIDGKSGTKTVKAIKAFQVANGLAADGRVGPVTQAVLFKEKAPINRDEGEPVQEPSPTHAEWPRQVNCMSYYGAVGMFQTSLALPYPMRLAWDKSVTIRKFSVHEKVHDSALRVFKRIADAYPEERRRELGIDLFGGCLNVRPMRGGKTYSMHSWGIAIDFDPERNQLKWGRDRARLAKPDAETFWKLWEEEGWLSLGRARNYDWMHVQAARL
jgi:hypothetical protein